MSDDRIGIEEVMQQYVDTVNAGDLTGWTNTVAEDAVFHAQDVPQVVGKSAVVAWAKESWFDPFKMNLSFDAQETQVLGSWAFVRGLFSLGLTPAAGGESSTVSGKFLNIFRREPDGSWKYARASFSFDAPMESGG